MREREKGKAWHFWPCKRTCKLKDRERNERDKEDERE